MKHIFTLPALFCMLQLSAQDLRPAKTTKQVYERVEVVQLDSFPASQLYFNSTLFLADAFSGVRETSQIRDAKAKSVATKGSFPVTIQNAHSEELDGKVVFTLVIQSRENMYRYHINDFYFAYTEETGITSYASLSDHLGMAMTPKQWKEVESQADQFLGTFIQSLKQKMTQTEVLCKEVLSANRKRKDAK
jgi:hypothetical protein